MPREQALRALGAGMAAASMIGCAARQEALLTFEPPAATAEQRRERDSSGPSPQEILLGIRATVEKDAREILGDAAWAEIAAAPTALVLRRSMSLPPMIRQPDGTWKAPPPSVVAAVRTPEGWVRVGAGSTRNSFIPPAGQELDRLLASPALWAEPALGEVVCTDGSGILVLVKHQGRERTSTHPCGLGGLTGEAAQIVSAGRISDWSKIPREWQPAGLPLTRFDEATQSSFRFNSGIYEERLMVIRDQPEWQGQWMRIMRARDAVPPRVDFTREMLLIAAMGPQRSGGYRAVIDRVIEEDQQLVAFVRFISPGPRCGVTGAITSPMDIVRLKPSYKDVRWVVEREVADC